MFITGFEKKESIVNTVDIGINVSDTTKSLSFYTEVMRMKRISTWNCPSEMALEADVNSGRAFDVIDLNLQCKGYTLKYKLNHTEGNLHKEKPADTTTKYSFEKPGAAYLTINAESVDPFIDRIEENNLPYKLVTLPNGQCVLLLHDPDGILIEISSL
jgi:catechol 2,3-dioxygenase-like lactoylglutathione lyase family enzyme